MPTQDEKLQLVKKLAAAVARRFKIEDESELWGVGWIGLADAESKHDPSRGPLLTFAKKCVRGAMIDSLKRRCTTLGVNGYL